jgi:hypothetical protein
MQAIQALGPTFAIIRKRRGLIAETMLRQTVAVTGHLGIVWLRVYVQSIGLRPEFVGGCRKANSLSWRASLRPSRKQNPARE